jgi:hypothetical protein
MTDRAQRDLAAEETSREFGGWFEAQGYPSPEDRYDGDEMAEAFTAGMQAQRDLDAAAAPRSVADRIAEDTRAYVSTRAGSFVTAFLVDHNVHVGFARAAMELDRLSDDHAISMPDANGRYTVPAEFVAATQTSSEGNR